MQPPAEPQLPLYVLALNNEKINAIALVQLSIKEQGIKGVGYDTSWNIKTMKEVDWQAAQAYWKKSISSVVASYRDGDITIEMQQDKGVYTPLIRNSEERNA